MTDPDPRGSPTREDIEWLVWFARKHKGKAADVAQAALDQMPGLRPATPPTPDPRSAGLTAASREMLAKAVDEHGWSFREVGIVMRLMAEVARPVPSALWDRWREHVAAQPPAVAAACAHPMVSGVACGHGEDSVRHDHSRCIPAVAGHTGPLDDCHPFAPPEPPLAAAGLSVDYEVMRKERGWPTPNHMRRTADALDALTPARYGDVLRWFADLADEALAHRAGASGAGGS